MHHRTLNAPNQKRLFYVRRGIQAAVTPLIFGGGQQRNLRSVTLEPSHVLRAMGMSPDQASSSMQICVGRDTTEGDIREAVERI